MRNISTLSAVIFLLSFFGTYFVEVVMRKKEVSMEVALVRGCSVILLPTGIGLLICAFDATAVRFMSEQFLPFLIAGSVTIPIAIKHGIPK
jgi:flagellar biosynthesis protein FliQ